MTETNLNPAKQFPPIVDVVYIIDPRYTVISKPYLGGNYSFGGAFIVLM